MKQIYLLFIAVFAITITQAQIIDIPDANFKDALVNTPCVDFTGNGWPLEDADTNDDGEIQVSEAEAVIRISIWNDYNISSVEGIEYFSNLISIGLESNPIVSVDLSSLMNLTEIYFTEMDELTTIFMKNGVDNSLADPITEEGGFHIYYCPNLSYICADDLEVSSIQSSVNASVTVNSYCASETVGDVAYVINGNHSLDSNLNGCDINDAFIPQLKYTVSNGIDSAIVITDSEGNFSFPVHQDGIHTVTPIMPDQNNPDYYIATPANQSINFPADSSPTDIDFCLTTNQNAIIYIPNSNFKNKLVNTSCWDSDGNGVVNNNDTDVDTNNDGEIQVSEAEAVTRLRIITTGINNVIGLEKFVNLEYLFCGVADFYQYDAPSYLYEINVSQMSNLIKLELPNNRLNALDLSHNPNLEILDCSENQLDALDLSNNLNLTYLNCSNYLETSDYYYDDYNNHISILDISNNINLTNLDCSNALFGASVIDFGSITGLIKLDCSENNIGSLNVSQFTNLSELSCYNSNLSELDLTQNLSLTKLFCYNDPYYNSPPFQSSEYNYDYDLENDNTLTVLDVSQNTQLTQLTCYRNDIETLIIGENPNLYYLHCQFNEITSLDVSNCTGLHGLTCNNNLITTLNLTNTPELSTLECSHNQLSDLNINQNPELHSLYCSFNQLYILNTSQNHNLTNLYCNSNQLTEIDLNLNIQLDRLQAQSNPLTHIFVKNGSQFVSDYFEGEYYYRFYVSTENLEYICADDFEIDGIQNILDAANASNVNLNSYCSFTPGGEFYTIQGQSKFDYNTNGCDFSDYEYPSLKLNITNGTTDGTFISNTSGNYSIPVQAGTHTITPILENPDYYTISPTSFVVDFPTDTSPFTQDFCITQNGTYNDLEVSILPTFRAVPGFDTNYKIVFRNKGNTVLSGSIDLTFQDDLMDLTSASPVVNTQSSNNLNWNFSDLLPLETREILVTMSLNTPTETPPLNGGDILGFVATINPILGDETIDDNTFELKQNVFNSYDPNDKTCLEGNTIEPDMIGKNVHYVVRFENTGTADAINIVVKDIIDTSKFDVNTLFLTDSSHDVVTRIRNTNIVEFIFENINLPFDDANNDGYIAFKIKTLATLVAGDTFENDAEIYFDYNFPINTNVALTTIESTLNTDDIEALNNIEIYPNPVNDKLFIDGLETIKSVIIYDISSRLINQVSYLGTHNKVEISTEKLVQGTYFVKVKTDVGEFVKKVVKK